jgi:hypothetical protein
LADLEPALEGARQEGDEQAAFLLSLTATAFQVIGLVALATLQAGPERTQTLAQARSLAAQVDEATNGAFNLAAFTASDSNA